MSARPLRTWLLITGVVLVVLQGLLVLAWWMLPRWAPVLVITHAPWPEPALRAWRGAGAWAGPQEVQDEMVSRLLSWGPAIGPALRREFEHGDERGRVDVIALATLIAGEHGIAAGTVMPDFFRPRFSDAAVASLREDLVHLVLAAMADGSSHLPGNAAYLAMPLCDPRTVPPICAYLAGQKPPVFEDLEPVVRSLGVMRDARAVPALIPLLPIRHRAHPVVEEALEACLDHTSLPHLLTATTHAHPVIREWAARQAYMYRYLESPALIQRLVDLVDDPERPVRIAAIQQLSLARYYAVLPRLFDLARNEAEDLPVRTEALDQLDGYGHPDLLPYLRSLINGPQRELKIAAIRLLGQWWRHEEAVPLLLSLLQGGDGELIRIVCQELERMRLTDDQRRQVTAAQAAQPVPAP